MIASLPFDWIFRINARNEYSRGPLYHIYIVMYGISVIYYMVLMVHSAERYQHHSSKTIVLLGSCFFFESSVQIFHPDMQLSWMAITLLIILNYIYFNTLWQQMDGLTRLLNQQSFLKACQNHRKNGTMIFMDVNRFKRINDQYGHDVGNSVLIKIAEILRDIYAKQGVCYRVGGDEFLVLLRSKANVKHLNDQFFSRIELEKEKANYFPDVSIGCVAYQKDEDLQKVFDEADCKMYKEKAK